MDVIQLRPAFTDHRGSITDLLNRVEIRHVAVLTSKSGTVRGNHYHEKADQYNYVISGKLELFAREPGQEIKKVVLRKGDLVLTKALCEHAMRFLEDSVLLVLTTQPRDEGGYEEDTKRPEVPLCAEDSTNVT